MALNWSTFDLACLAQSHAAQASGQAGQRSGPASQALNFSAGLTGYEF